MWKIQAKIIFIVPLENDKKKIIVTIITTIFFDNEIRGP